MAGYVGNIPVPQGTQTRQSFTATASQTSFPTIGYTEGFIDVHLNGVKLLAGVDFNVGGGNGSDVILATGAALNDILEVTIFDTFDTSSGTFSNTTLKNNVTLKNDTEQDTDGGRASKIIYQGEQSGGEISTLAEIQASHDGTADDEKGDLIFRTNDGSDGSSPTEAMRITSDQQLGIGTVDPLRSLHVSGAGDTGLMLQTTNAVDDKEIWEIQAAADGSNHANLIMRTRVNAGTGGAEAVRVSNDGKVRVGGDSATLSNSLTVEGASYTLFGMKRNTGVTTGTGELGIHMETNSQTTVSFDDEGSFVFGQAATPTTAAGFTELLRIDNDGRLRCRTGAGDPSTSQAGVRISGVNGDNFWWSSTTNTSGYDQLRFMNPNGTVGSITTSGSGTSFNTSSDYRLKENVTNITDGITRVKQLSPRRFNFIADPDTIVDGFIAHEAQTVVPEAVSGTKDAMMEEEYEVTPAELDDNGRIVNEAVMGTRTVAKIQGIDQAKLVPLLTAALQEAIAKIETLETKVATLEAE